MDKLLNELFNIERWQYALEKGAGQKDMNKASLRALEIPEVRAHIYQRIATGNYKISPPHQALIPKDNGEFRTVYVNEDVDRILLSITNDMLFELLPHMIHPSCKSYQKGIGCGKVVQEVSRNIIKYDDGWKADLSKYFDSVPIEYIDNVFDRIESELGKSALIDVLRDYYHSDLCFDPEGNLITQYQSLKQGCAVASFLADVMLYDIDEKLSSMGSFYVRYSDDILYIGKESDKAMQILSSELNRMQMKLNPKKVERVNSHMWFKFLGFSIRGNEISISKNRLKTFQKEIEKRTTKSRNGYVKALNKVNTYLYKGNGEYSWASQMLPIVNVDEDIQLMNQFVMDCLRATQTGKKKTGGLGYNANGKKGVVVRGIGKNVKANRNKTDEIEGYYSLKTMQNALRTNKNAYDVLCSQL